MMTFPSKVYSKKSKNIRKIFTQIKNTRYLKLFDFRHRLNLYLMNIIKKLWQRHFGARQPQSHANKCKKVGEICCPTLVSENF